MRTANVKFVCMNTIKLLLALCSLLISLTIKAQPDPQTSDPVIGQPFPNYSFQDIVGYPDRSLTINELKGKWLVLDFWNEFCASCVSSFPKIDTLQRKFANNVKFVLVGYNKPFFGNRTSAVKKVYEKLKANFKLILTVAFDSVLYDNLEIGGVGCPYIVIIDPNGIVRYLTEHVTEKDIQAILNNEKPRLNKIKRALGKGVQKSSDPNLIDTNYIYETAISKSFKSGYYIKPDLPTDSSSTNIFELNGMTLDYLYRFALTGETYWDSYNYPLYKTFKFYPILEILDSSNFDSLNKFWFKLKLPYNITKREVMLTLQKSLYESFGYSATVEKREVRCWKVLLKDSTYRSKLLTKGGNSSITFRDNNKFLGASIRNEPFKYILIYLAASFQQQGGKEFPFVDETNINENVDIDINALLSDFNDFKRALSKSGIEIKLGFKEMNCIVIRENR